MCPQTAVLQLISVNKTYGKTVALGEISADVQRGELFGVVGPDGAGKSTMMRIAIGIIRPDRGEVRLLGSHSPRAARALVGYVPQRFGLYPNLTVMENIRLYGALYGASRAEIDSSAKDSLGRMELWKFRDRLAGNLSGGMKQKLTLAVGLIHKPCILFLDEPTTGVDPLSRREFWAILYELNLSGVTIILSTPYMDEAELCTDLVLLNKGEAVMRGAPGDLIEGYGNRILEVDTSSAEVEKILSAVPGVLGINLFGAKCHVEIKEDRSSERAIRRALDSAGFASVSLREIRPSLEDLFVSRLPSAPQGRKSER